MIKVRGTWTPNVDYNALAKGVLVAMAAHPARLTGREVRFVRHYFEMTLQQFAERFGVSHPAVLKWEKAGARQANLTWGTEKDLRLFILDSLGAKAKEIADTYRSLARPMRASPRRIVMDPAVLSPPLAVGGGRPRPRKRSAARRPAGAEGAMRRDYVSTSLMVTTSTRPRQPKSAGRSFSGGWRRRSSATRSVPAR